MPLNGGRGAALLARRDRLLPLLGLEAAGDAVLETVDAAEQLLARDAAVLAHDLCGVRSAAAELVELAQHREAGGALGDDERALAAVPRVGIDGGDHDVHVGDAAVTDEHLVAVNDPVAAVQARAGLDERMSLPPLGSVTARAARAASLISSGAEALRRPLNQLLVGRGLTDRR